MDDKKPDMIEQTGDLIARFVRGEAIAGTLYRDRQSTVVIASAVLAVAGELRDIHNVLHEINGKLATMARGGDA